MALRARKCRRNLPAELLPERRGTRLLRKQRVSSAFIQAIDGGRFYYIESPDPGLNRL